MLGAALTNCAMGNYEADYDEFMSISVPNRYVITGTTTQMCCLKTGGGEWERGVCDEPLYMRAGSITTNPYTLARGHPCKQHKSTPTMLLTCACVLFCRSELSFQRDQL